MAYATLEAFKTYRGIAAATVVDDTLLRDLLERASKAIDSYCSRRFSANSETRYYEAGAVDGTTLHLDDDLISIDTSGVTNGDSSSTTIASTNYWLLPRNGGPPYYAIRLKTDCDYSWEFDTDYWVSVAGDWGWSLTPPDDIVQACIRLASYYYAQKDTPIFETTVFPESGIVSVPTGMPIDVKQLLEPYRRRAG